MDNKQRRYSQQRIPTNVFETIVIGDAYCGKSTYLKEVIESEKRLKRPIRILDEHNEFEFVVSDRAESKRAVFRVKDTANQERFRSLTQSYYRDAQCVLLIFDLLNAESFYNLNKWHTDVMSYCKNQTSDKFAIVLVGLKSNKQIMEGYAVRSCRKVDVDMSFIEKFQEEKTCIIEYCEIDLAASDDKTLKQPFVLLFEYLSKAAESRIQSPDYFNPYVNRDSTQSNSDPIRNRSVSSSIYSKKEKTTKCCNIL